MLVMRYRINGRETEIDSLRPVPPSRGRPETDFLRCGQQLLSGNQSLIPCLQRHAGKNYAPIAQLDRATVCGTVGRRFESSWAYHIQGEMAEWSKAVDSKSTVPARGPWVRIPLSPPACGWWQWALARKGLTHSSRAQVWGLSVASRPSPNSP